MATVTLTWQAPASGGPVDNYKVYRVLGATTDQATVKAGTVLTSSLSSSTFTYDDTSLSSGAGAHSYTVTAVNTGGESAGATPTTQTL
jgi:hypothetical protein